MKKSLSSLLFVSTLLTSSSLFAVDVTSKGFIAIDAINYEKIQRKEGAPVIGIGDVYLKFIAEQDDLTANIKLKIKGDLTRRYTLFEEAYAAYKVQPGLKFGAGKGTVLFQNIHWGVNKDSFQNDGAITKSESGFYKLSNKAMLFVNSTFGNLSHTFWFWGEPSDAKNINDVTVSKSGYVQYMEDPSMSFNTARQLGLASKLEYNLPDKWKVTQGLVYYKHKRQPKPTIGGDISIGRLDSATGSEIWSEIFLGQSSTGMFDRYASYLKKEFFVQAGFEVPLFGKWSYLNEVEYMVTQDQAHVIPASVLEVNKTTTTPINQSIYRSGSMAKTILYKIDAGFKYKLSKSGFITIGGLYENKKVSLNGVNGLTTVANMESPNADAFRLSASLAFWF